MNTTTIRVGGVPEHFNLPIHLAREQKLFETRGVSVEWTTYKGGTGQMIKAMADGEIDLCILLTEGILNAIVKGSPLKIISEYVTTPLTWGIHTGTDNPLDNYRDIYTKKYGISRFGSGSHLMAIVDANSNGHTLRNDQFEVVKNLDGALNSLGKLETDVFYWEKYTTKPWVNSGQLRRVGEYKTPWPCFVIAATDDILAREPDNVIRILRTIHDSCDHFMQNDEAIKLVSDRFGQKLSDVERWYHNTEWAIHGWVSEKMLKSVIFHLRAADIIGKEERIPELIWRR
ncbi:MAG: sulfonate transport system substrate-binding protein [Saprospiraceae bacterium]|jgi:sulfonate transport system substrate-binding protein